MKKIFNKVSDTVSNLLHQKDGPLTRELLLKPGKFGLGKTVDGRQPDRTTTTTCGFCSTGCGLNIHLKDGKAIGLTPDVEYPVNIGMACPKGWESLEPLKSSDRGIEPLLRDEEGNLIPVEWDEALQAFCANFKDIQNKYGDESVAFISTGQIPIEEMAMLGCISKFGMNMIHGDGNTRQCMATAVVAYKQSFGFDAPGYTYQDFEESDTIVLIGSNLCISHPIMWERICKNKNDPNLIVIDPRKTETAIAAKEHYAIQAKSDLTFFYAIANVLIENNWIKKSFIKEHTNLFEEYKEFLKDYSLEMAAEASGIPADQITKLAKTIYHGGKVSFWWTMGVNQSHEGVRIAQSIINLALMTGNIGKPGTGANSITGQCNAMGSRLFSNTTSLLGGHDFLNPDHRKKIAGVLDIEEERIPKVNSLPYHKILEGVREGKIKGLWVIATNPAHSWIHQSSFKETMKKLDFLVVQDMYHSTETAQMADLFLPAASWGEKEGVFINSERRLGMIKKVAESPGKALADFYIFRLIAKYWGCEDLIKNWKTPQDVFQTLKECTRDTPCDITGIEDYRYIDHFGGVQWPLKEGHTMNLYDYNERRLFEKNEFFHDDKKAKFLFEKPRAVEEKVNEDFPYILLTGRGTSAQWHTQTRTAKCEVLRKLYPEEIYIEINTEDATALKIESDDMIEVYNRRGIFKAKAVISPAVKKRELFIPMHYDLTNLLTFPSFDPYSFQPSYKYCAVSIRAKKELFVS